jgi:hypothetical protein
MVPTPPNAGIKFGQRHRHAREAMVPPSARQRQITSGRRVMGADESSSSARAAVASGYSASRAHSESSGRATSGRAGVATDSVRTSESVTMDKAQDTFLKRFIAKNAHFIGELDPSMAALSFSDQVRYLKEHLGSRYGGDHVRFFNDLQGDERDLRLRGSVQVRASIHPVVTYGVPHSQTLDGYETARQKHRMQIERVLASARSSDAPYYNRTKGTLSDYGSFSSWAKFRQLNATAMLNR